MGKITAADKAMILRHFRVALTPRELERSWPRLEERHRERVKLLGPRLDIRSTVMASFGISMLEAPVNFRESLFDDADRARYQAKENGRNRVFMSFTGWETEVFEMVVKL